MIKIVSKAFNDKAHDSIDIPDISHPIVLHKVKPTPLSRKYQPELGEYKLELEFYGPNIPRYPNCQFQLGKFLNFETYLEIDGKEYLVCSGVRMLTGGSTPNASADRKMTCLAAGPWDNGRTIFSMW